MSLIELGSASVEHLQTAASTDSGSVETLQGISADRAAIFVSACVAGVETVFRLVHPQAPSHLVALGIAA